jgi:hypothetical protein
LAAVAAGDECDAGAKADDNPVAPDFGGGSQLDFIESCSIGERVCHAF